MQFNPDEDLAALQYTGGTTGTSKRRHANPQQPRLKRARFRRHGQKAQKTTFFLLRCRFSTFTA